MRKILGLLMIALLLIPTLAIAGDEIVIEEPKDDIPVVDGDVRFNPNITEWDSKPVADVKYTTVTRSIITTFMELVGLDEKEVTTTASDETIKVEIDGGLVGEIPSNSKFAGMEVHERCVVYQYGTDGWYDCERSLL
jgi:hypothetical protein